MTNKEIRRAAGRRMMLSGGSCISLDVFWFSVMAFIMLCEITTYIIFQNTDTTWIYEPGQIFRDKYVTLYWCIKSSLEMLLLTPIVFLQRRMFIDVVRENSIADTRAYINNHALSYYSRAVYSELVYIIIRVFAAVPGLISVYGIYHWLQIIKVGELNSVGLSALMGCVGFTGVWVFLTAHYYISLALTPYIMALNPRTNVFDACDLSVKLMEGKHLRYIKFMGFFILLLPTLVMVYPIFLLYPFFKLSYTMLMDELLGEYSQDKMPGMIRRWRKHL